MEIMYVKSIIRLYGRYILQKEFKSVAYKTLSNMLIYRNIYTYIVLLENQSEFR